MTFARWRPLSAEKWSPVRDRSISLPRAVLIYATIATAKENNRTQRQARPARHNRNL